MTPVLMQFLLPTGEPCAFAQVEIQLSRATFNEDVDGTDGVIMPRYLQAQTGADGKVLVELMPAAEHYHVTAYDTLTDAGLHYHFVVPELTPDQLPPGAALRLQDLITDGSSVSQNYDEKALALIAQTKMSVIADRAAVEIFKTASEAAAAAADASKVVAVDSAAAAQADRILAGEEATSATNSASLASTKANEAVNSATAALASEDAAKASEDDALASKNAAATSEANAADSATTATTKAGEAAGSATAADAAKAAAETAQTAAETAQGLSEAARDEAQAARETATTKATEAADSAATASNKASQLSSQLFSFNEIYIGKFAAAPTVDGNGNALKVGAIYENTVEGKIFQWEADLAWHPYDEEATTALNNAILSASNAAASEGLATQAKDTAVTKAAEALASKEAAATSATNAATSAADALASKQAAKTSEDNAKTAETSAVNAMALKASLSGAQFTGNVGIGAAPRAKLEVAGGSDGALILGHSYAAGKPNFALKIEGNAGTTSAYLTQYGASGGYVLAQGANFDGAGNWKPDSNAFSSIAGVGDGSVRFFANTGLTAGTLFAPTERVRIAADGKVGVGTAAPEAKLHINGAAGGALVLDHTYGFGEANWALKLKGSAGTSGGYLSQAPASGGFQLTQGGTYYGGGNYITDANSTSFASITGSGGALTFITASGLTASSQFSVGERMKLETNGNLSLVSAASAFDFRGTGGAQINNYRTGDLEIVNRSGGALNFYSGNTIYAGRFDASGNLLIGITSAPYRLVVGGTAGVRALIVNQAANSEGFSGQNSAIFVGKTTDTGRSIAAAGSVSAPGADYAEYMTKADGCGVLEKGAIVGIDTDGKLTDKWADAVSFMVKSTDPSYVGGDTWGSEEALNTKRPEEPQFSAPEYAGAAHPGDAPTEPVLVDEASEEQLAAYAVAHAAHQGAEAAYRRDQLAHQDLVEDASREFYTVGYPAYEAELAAFNEKLEAARQRVDRIAYCGQVPVNVTGATPGQYVVPVQAGEGIGGELVDKSAMTLDQYMSAVGVVQNILPDGRANVRVKAV